MTTHKTASFRFKMPHTRASLLGVLTPLLLSVGCVADPEPPQQETDAATGGGDELSSDDVEIDFTPERASGLIVDDQGQTIGYVDAKLQERDLEGKLVTAPTASAHQFFSTPQRVMLYDNANYSGTSTSYHNASLSFTANLNSYHNNRLSSVVAAPGCKVELYDGLNQTGALIYTVNPNKGAAVYVNLTGSHNDKASSMRVTCANNANILCGYLYKDINYAGDAFPVYNEYRYQLAGFAGWNDTVSSVAFNPYATCDGIGLWQHHDVFSSNIDTRQRRLFLHHKSNNANLHNKGMGDQVSSLEADRELAANESNNSALGRALQEMQTRRSWGKAFVCNAMKEICVDHKAAITGMTTLTGIYTCGKLVGSGVVTALFTAAATIATGGAAGPAVAPLDAFAAGQVIKGVGCLAAVGAAVIIENAVCSATMETYCAAQAR